MPAMRVTVALNSKQSQRAPLLIPPHTSFDPFSSSTSCYSLVIKAAQSKLRLKKASRIFAPGGRELTGQRDWEDALEEDMILLVSAGEEYVGSRTEDRAKKGEQDGQDSEANPNCTIEVLAERAFVDALAITQLETTARSLPGIQHAVAQPDLHPGTKFPIGAVFVSKGWIHPPLIGGDIGCGMAWYKTALSRGQVEGDKGRKIAEKLRGLEGPWRTQVDRETWLEGSPSDGDFSAGEQWDLSLGTIGAGNHFVELQVVEESKASSTSHGKLPTQLYEGEIVLLVHSGSRGYGGDILKRYTRDGRISMRDSDPRAKSYLEEHDRACSWASRNRDLIALRFFALLEPGAESWDLGLNTTAQSSTHQIRDARLALSARKVVDIFHNNVERTAWPPTGPPNRSTTATTTTTSSPDSVYIHRKGAAPTSDPQTHLLLPILPLPGSRATPTLILHPLLSPSNTYGRTNALSLAHGAGRALSRAKAATYVADKYAGNAADLLRGDFVRSDKRGNKRWGEGGDGAAHGRDVNGGTWVVCEEQRLVWEEAGEAYKDVWDVGADLVAKGCAEGWGWCRGRVSYKVRKEGGGC